MKAQFQGILRIPAMRRGGMACMIMLLALAFLSGLAGCSPKSAQPDAASVVERSLTAKKDNDFEAWKATLWPAQKGRAELYALL